MSFVVDAVKKVFKKVKKVVKRLWDNKWVRTAVLIGATVFTAGLAAGGWTYQVGQGLGSFFSSVGNTFSAGWNSITSAFTGAGKEAGGGALVDDAVKIGDLGAADAVIPGPADAVSAFDKIVEGTTKAFTSTPAADAGGGGSFFNKALGWLFGNTKGASFARNALAYGMQAYAQNEQWEAERWYKDNATVYGGPAFGGSEDITRQPLKFTAGTGSAQQFAMQRMRPIAAPAGEMTPEEFANQQNAPGSEGQPSGGFANWVRRGV